MPRKKSDTSPSELDVQEKQAFPLTARLNKLITDSTVLRKHLNCTAQTISQYRTGTSRPSLENLCKIADFYSVSTDYLLGRTPNKTTNPKLQEISEYTGLSAASAEYLHNSVNAGRAQVLELLISHPWILDTLHAYLYNDIDSVARWNGPPNDKFEGKPPDEYERVVALADSKHGKIVFSDPAILEDAILLKVEGDIRKIKEQRKEAEKNGQHQKGD